MVKSSTKKPATKKATPKKVKKADKSTADDADIVIIGGGLVGLCAALILKNKQRKISILEATNLDAMGLNAENSNGLNARSIALSISSVQIFKALGIWPAIEKKATPIRDIHVSARGHWGVTRLHASEYQLNALGYVIESSALGRCLLDALQASQNIDLLQQAKFESLEQGSKVEISFQQNGQQQQIKASIALIADGAQSMARASLGIDQQTTDYAQTVIICNLQVSRAKPGMAYERFTNKGPLAMLPLGDNRYSCIWTLDNETGEKMMLLDDQAFKEALQACFGFRLGIMQALGKRFSTPIVRVQASVLHKHRCLLVGNAANSLHPVAGQSFNLGLRDIASLYEILIDSDLSSIDDLVLADITQRYQDIRSPEQKRVIRLGDGLVNLFSNDLPLFKHLRSFGLAVLDVAPPLKAQVALSGMGLGFSGNRLLRAHL